MTQHNICTEVTEADHAMINVRHAVSIYGSARLKPLQNPKTIHLFWGFHYFNINTTK